VPTGGTDGQILTKTSSTDYATAWEDIPESAGIIASATPPLDINSIWFNTENGSAYIYYDDFWTSISGAGSGGTSSIKLNEQIISQDYSIPTGYNGISAGPITIADGVVVTVPTGSSWSIV
jgi:hypothetical protein